MLHLENKLNKMFHMEHLEGDQMSKSIISNERKCLMCGVERGLHKHHIFFGTANRKKSEQDGCWCYLCQRHHNGSLAAVHANHNLDVYLKQLAQRKWQEVYNKTTDDFIKRYGRNYLD